VSGWSRPVTPPDWIKDVNGWQMFMLKMQLGKILFRYEDLPRMLEAAKPGGVPFLFLWAWWKGGMNNRHPEYDLDDRMGGEELFKKRIQEVRQQGGRVLLYTQGKLVDPATPYYAREGRDIIIRNRWGVEVTESWVDAADGAVPRIGWESGGRLRAAE